MESCAILTETIIQNGLTPKGRETKGTGLTNLTQASTPAILTGLMSMVSGSTSVQNFILSTFQITWYHMDGHQRTLFHRSRHPRTSTVPIWTLHCMTSGGSLSTPTCGPNSGMPRTHYTHFHPTQAAHHRPQKRNSTLPSNSTAQTTFRRSSRTPRPCHSRFDRVTPLNV